MDLDSKLKDSGVNEIKYYYKNCPIVGNLYTVCLLISEEKKVIARGISICSLSDSHNKKTARQLSKNRAICANFKKINSLTIADYDDDIVENRIDRYFTNVVKSFKIKNEEHKQELIKEIEKLKFQYSIKNLDTGERLEIYIPYTYPIDSARTLFLYKSEFNPKATEEEKKMFKVL